MGFRLHGFRVSSTEATTHGIFISRFGCSFLRISEKFSVFSRFDWQFVSVLKSSSHRRAFRGLISIVILIKVGASGNPECFLRSRQEGRPGREKSAERATNSTKIEWHYFFRSAFSKVTKLLFLFYTTKILGFACA